MKRKFKIDKSNYPKLWRAQSNANMIRLVNAIVKFNNE